MKKIRTNIKFHILLLLNVVFPLESKKAALRIFFEH